MARKTDKLDKLSEYNSQSTGTADSGLSVCKERVSASEKWRKAAKNDEKWSRFIKMYGNQYDYPELSAYDDIVAPNMVFSTVNVIVPSVVVNYPKITVMARKPEDEANGATVEAFSNYTWTHHDVHKEVKACVKDFIIIGHGVGKVTWVLTEEEVELTRDEWRDAVSQALMEADAARTSSEAAGLGVEFPSEDEIIGSVPETKVIITADHPAVDRISPFDMLFDVDATRFKSATWIAQKLYVPIKVARENKDWNAAQRKKLAASAMSTAKMEQDTLFEGEDRGKEANYAVVFEYYDLLDGTVCTFGEGCDDWLIAPAKVETPFAHPFVFCENYSIPEKLYPMGDIEAIAPLQLELALTRTQMINDRKRYRRMYLVNEDKLGPDGMAALTSGDDNVFVPVEGDSPFADVLAPIGTSPLPPEFYNQTAMILDDMNLVSGVTEYQRGSVAEVRRTATEAAMIQDMSNARSADKLAIIEQFIGELAQKTVQLAQEFLTTDQVARIVGVDGATQWVPYTREDIAGEFDFNVEAGSTQPQNETFRRQSAMQLMDALAPFVSLGVVDPAALADHLMREGFGIKETERFIIAPEMRPPGAPGGPPLPPEATGAPSAP